MNRTVRKVNKILWRAKARRNLALFIEAVLATTCLVAFFLVLIFSMAL